MQTKNMRKSVRQFLAIITGITIFVIGFSFFILPHHIVVGGMAGFSTLVYYATGGILPIAVIIYGSNFVLLICGYRYLGRGFVLRTIFGSTVLSLLIGFTEGYVLSHPPLVTSPGMSIVLGSVLMGLGIGVYYSNQGTTGGTDIVAAIMEHTSNVSIGRVMIIIDMTIVATSFLLPFDGDMEARIQARSQTVIYGLMSIAIYSFLADWYVAKGKQTVQFIILSEKWDEMAHRITHETGRGATVWDATGYWTGNSKKLMIVWCRQANVPDILRIAHEVDPTAYVTTCEVRSVYGNGFDRLRPRPRRD